MQNFAHLLLEKFAYSKKKSYLCTEICDYVQYDNKGRILTKIDHSLQQAAEGKVYRSMPGESADAFLDRLIAMGD